MGPPTAHEMCKYSAFQLHWRGLKESVMCKYCAFKGAPNSNYNVWASCFQRSPKQQLYCESTLLSKGSPTAVVMFKYLAFTRAPNSNFSMRVPCFHRGHQQQLKFVSALLSQGPPVATLMCKYLAFRAASNCNVQIIYFQREPKQQL